MYRYKLINIYEKYISYPIEVFPSTWDSVGDIAKIGEVISPREVLREIEVRDDQLYTWARRHITFQKLDSEQQTIVRDIMSKYSALVDLSKPTPDADPFVIALAKSKNCIVITQENYVNLGGPKSKPKIPNVCEAYKVKWIRILDLFKEKGWQFKS